MAYIYKIVNDINGKIYIGKTEFSIEKRWKTHIKDSKINKYKNRPLYRAFNKYGIENFHIELVEETDNPEEREIYWIEQYGSFKYGYNATKGGDGKKYLDYDKLIETYKQTENLRETAEICNCERHYLSEILKNNNIEIISSSKNIQKKYGKMINQYTKEGEYIQSFSSIKEASRFINKEKGYTHISEVCNGKRKTAYGYIWKFA